MPAGNSPDLNGLFTQPEEWLEARKRVDTFIFSPGQLQQGDTRHPSPLAADAFRRLQAWGLRLALEVPALKEWDCSARRTVPVTTGLMSIIATGGGTVRYLAMDEPLVSALGLNAPVCRLDINAAASAVADYARTVTTRPKPGVAGDTPEIIDIEAYPVLSVAQIEQWLLALQRHGFRPAAFHLDADLHAIDTNPGAKARLAEDLQELKKFLSQQNILFGVIIWSGYDPVRSDAEYYARSMAWTRILHDAIGRPDRVIFESWVKRCSLFNDCIGPALGCTTSDPAYCGTISVPLNLPQSGTDDFSHARLITAATAILTEP